MTKTINFDKSYIYAVSTLVGTTIGAGIFGLPYAASRSGFVLAAFMLVLVGIITLITNLMFAEVTLRTKKNGRMVYYCEKYIGKNGKVIATFIVLFSLYSSILAYIIIGGMFLSAIFSPYFGGDEFIYSIVIFAITSAAIYINLKLVSIIESLMVVFLFLTIFAIMLKGSFYVDPRNLLTFDTSQIFFPFGVILFSMGALSAIPEFEYIIKKKQERIKSAVIIGTVIPIVIYFLFMAIVIGVTGENTTKDAMDGLNHAMGDGVVVLGLLFGILAIATSYLVIGVNLKETFWYDYKMSEKKAWFLACFVPFAVYILGIRDFITVVNIAGGIAGGLTGILVVILFYKAREKGDSKPAFQVGDNKAISLFMILIYLLGIIYQFVYKAW